MSPTDLDALLQHPERVSEIPPEQLPALLAQLAALQSLLSARLLAVPGDGAKPGPTTEEDRWLTAEEAAALLRVDRRWLYRRAGKLPFCRKLSRKKLLLSEAGLKRWIASKRV